MTRRSLFQSLIVAPVAAVVGVKLGPGAGKYSNAVNGQLSKQALVEAMQVLRDKTFAHRQYGLSFRVSAELARDLRPLQQAQERRETQLDEEYRRALWDLPPPPEPPSPS